MKKFVNDKRQKPEPEVTGMAVALRDGESTESLIRRFKRMVESSGVLKELRRREYYLSPTEKRKEKGRRAAKRRAKAARMESGRDD